MVSISDPAPGGSVTAPTSCPSRSRIAPRTLSQLFLLSPSVQRSNVADMMKRLVCSLVPGLLLLTVQLASCTRLRLEPHKILIATPVSKGLLSIEQQARLDAALSTTLSARRFTAPERPNPPVAQTSPCTTAGCAMVQGAKTRSGYIVTWSIDRDKIVWAKTTAASLPTETPVGNKHASETELTSAGELRPRTASSADWRFLLSLYEVSEDKHLGEKSIECKACTEEEAERSLVEVMIQLLELLPHGK